MANNYIYVQGKAKWMGGLGRLDETYNKWSFPFYPDDKSLNVLRELSLKNTISKDDDGWMIRLSRPGTKVYKGVVKPFTPPVIIDKDNKIIEANGIGNGSDVTAKLEVYQWTAPGTNKRNNAIRLESVRVDNLIPYEKDKDMKPETLEMVDGLDKQEEQLF